MHQWTSIVQAYSHFYSSAFSRHYHSHTRPHYATIANACANAHRTKSTEQSLKAESTKTVLRYTYGISKKGQHGQQQKWKVQ